MKRSLKYILFASIIFLSTIANAQKQRSSSLTLTDVIKLTMENHPLLKQKEDELRAAQFRVEQQKSSYLPYVGAEGSYTRIGPIPAFSFGGQTLALAPANNYNVGLFIHQTVYDFGRRDAQVDYASSFLNTIKDNKELVKNNLIDQAIKVFYGILSLEKSIALKDTQIISLNEHLKITELKIQNGLATDYDVLSTKSKIAQIKSEIIDLSDAKTRQEYFLKELIGNDKNNEITLDSDFSLPDFVLDADSLLDIAYSERTELKLLSDSRNSAELKKELVSQLNNPVVNVDLGYGLKNGYEPNIEVLRGNWFAKLSVSVPIFEGYLTENKVNEASALIDLENEKTQQLRKRISTDVLQSESQYSAGLKKITSTEEQIMYATNSLERAKIQYEKGAGTNLEVLDAETTLAGARLQNIQAKFSTIINYYSLMRAIGKLDPESYTGL